MNIEERAQEYQDAKSKAEALWSALFDDYHMELLERVKKICTLKTLHTAPTTTCCADNAIEQGIAKMSLQDMLVKKYPMSELEWRIEAGNFYAGISACFRHETDAYTEIRIPFSQADFDEYCKKLQAEADQRGEWFTKKKLEEEAKKVEAEKEMLKRLKEKYKE